MDKPVFKYKGIHYGLMTWECVSGYGSYKGLAITPGSTIGFYPEWFWRHQK